MPASITLNFLHAISAFSSRQTELLKVFNVSMPEFYFQGKTSLVLILGPLVTEMRHFFI